MATTIEEYTSLVRWWNYFGVVVGLVSALIGIASVAGFGMAIYYGDKKDKLTEQVETAAALKLSNAEYEVLKLKTLTAPRELPEAVAKTLSSIAGEFKDYEIEITAYGTERETKVFAEKIRDALIIANFGNIPVGVGMMNSPDQQIGINVTVPDKQTIDKMHAFLTLLAQVNKVNVDTNGPSKKIVFYVGVKN